MYFTARCLAPLAAAALLEGCLVGSGRPERVEAPPDSAAGEVGFTLEGPGGAALTVPVHINGKGPFDFILDTGATFTCVDQALADSLGLPERRGQVGMGAGVGMSGQLRIVEIDSLRIGAARAEELAACALDLRHVRSVGLETHGLLGLNFLRSFRVTLDFERRVLLLQDPDSVAAD